MQRIKGITHSIFVCVLEKPSFSIRADFAIVFSTSLTWLCKFTIVFEWSRCTANCVANSHADCFDISFFSETCCRWMWAIDAPCSSFNFAVFFSDRCLIEDISAAFFFRCSSNRAVRSFNCCVAFSEIVFSCSIFFSSSATACSS